MALATVGAMTTGLSTHAANVSWVGPNNGFWDIAGNWNPGLPGVADDALLGAFDTELRSGTVSIRSLTGTGRLTISGGSLSLSNASSIGALALTGGTLGGTGTLTANGASSWTNGTMSGAGTTVFNGALAISSDNIRFVSAGHVITANGTTTWTNGGTGSSGNIAIGNAVINNAGTWLDQNAFTVSVLLNGGSATFNNTGTYTKSGNSTTTFQAAFNNTSSGPGTGVVNVNAGTLVLSGGGTSNGKFDVAAGATLSFNGGTYALNGTVAGAGTGQMLVSGGTVNTSGGNAFGGQLGVSGGTLNVGGTFDTVGLNVSGSGTLGGTGTLTASGASSWTSGVMSGAGTTVINGPFAISSDNIRSITTGHVLTANGTTTWTNGGTGNAGLIFVSGGGVINNAGTWLDQNAFANQIAPNGTTGTFNNTGTYTKSGALTTTIGIAFNNTASGPGTGVVNVNAGTLLLSGGGSSTGKFDVASGATLNLGGGTFNLTGTVAGAGTGQMLVSGGTVNTSGSNAFGGQLGVSGGTLNVGGTFDTVGLNVSGSGTLGGTGTLTASGASSWTSGVMSGAGTTVINGPFAISSDNIRSITTGHVLTANGTTTWTNGGTGNAGLIFVSGGGVINNAGTWLDQNAFANQIAPNGTTGTFNNTGTYTKSGALTTTIGIAFNNTASGPGTGVVNVNAGTLLLSGGGSSTGKFDVASGATLNLGGGTFNLTGTVAGAGTGQMLVSGGTVNTSGSNAFGGQLGVSGGTLNVGGTFDTVGLNVSGSGTLGGTGTLTASGASSWTSGVMSGAGATIINGPFAISGDLQRQIQTGHVLTANGTTTWTNGGTGNAGLIFVSGGGVINNAGTWLDQNAFANQIAPNGTTGAFNNTGTYTKSGALTTTIGIAFNNTASGPGTGVVNVNAGTLLLSGGGSSTGKFDVASGATLNLGGGTFNLTGTVAGAGTGQMLVSGGTVNTSGSNAFGGQLGVSGGTLNVGGTFDTVGLNVSGSGTLGGTGTLTASGASSWTSGVMSGAGATIINGPFAISGDLQRQIQTGHVLTANGTTTWINGGTGNAGLIFVSGGGVINNAGTWLDQNAFANQIAPNGTTGAFNNTGTYTKSGAGTTTIGIAFNNAGVLDVQAGRLVLSDVAGVTGNGTLRIGAAGAVTASSGNNTVAVLDHLGGAGSLDIGTRTITVSSDYTNANFGTGNTFNRRANVTTSGAGNRIVASGNANQGVTGSSIANGSGTTPSLTLGNVHVGATTVTYNIVNTGNSGPSLRGAIQTSVNGASLTDARLSGNGASAGSWGAVATGAALSRDVTLTIGSAGVYAPLTGQVVNILNNFDNTRSQLLTINSSAGAAAYNLASANVIAPLNFGVVHVGDTVSQALSISNTAAVGAFSEMLNASFGTTSDARILTSGSIGLLAAGATNNTSMLVGLNTAVAGLVSGTATVLLQSDGTGTSGLGITGLPSQLVGVSGDIQTVGQVFRLAQPSFHTPEPVSFGNVRIGAATNQNLSLTNLAANDGFSEKLNASVGAATAGVTAGGAFNLLAAQGTNGTSLHVGIDTTTAGAKAGTATITLVSDGTGTSGLGQTALPSQTVNVSGNVYRLATAGAHTPEPVVIVNQRVGGTASQFVTLTNTAANDGFSEKLNATIGGATGSATAIGSFTLLGAAASNGSALSVGVNTASAGAKSGTATISLASDGAGTSGFSALNIGTQVVNVAGNVYNAAVGAATPAPVVFSNRHVGDVATQVLTIANTAPTGAFSEALNASFSGTTGNAISNGGTAANVAAGSSNGTSLSIGLNTGAAGARSGTATLSYQSDGTGSNGNSGLAAIAAGSQVINVSGNVYRLASSNAIGAVNFGAVHVGDTVSQALSVTNTAANDGFSEKLSASFGATSDARILTSGSIGLLAAGATDNTNMRLSLNTAAAGVVSGTATVLLQSDGTGTSGLGITGLASQLVGVSGDIQTVGQVFRLAQPSFHAPEPVSFGNVRIGAAANQNLSLTNLAANDGFSEKLNATIGAATAGVNAGGAFNLLAAQGTNNTSLHVGIDTTTAGAKTGTAILTLVSDGTGTSGLGQTALPSQTVNVSGNVYRLANPTLETTTIDLAARVGDATPTRSITITNTSPDAFTERLNASIGAGPAGFTTSGSVTGLVAGANSDALGVSLNTAAAGTFAGPAAITFLSSGAGTTGAADASVGSQNVALTGNVYTAAVAQLNTTVVDFGIVHRGDAVAGQNISVTNSAASSALNDTLSASAGGSAAPFIVGGSASGIAAGATNAAALSAGLNTTNTGLFTGGATVTFVSHDPQLADLSLASASLSLKAQVNDFAKMGLAKSGGAGSFSGGATNYTLDFGTLLLGSGSLGSSLTLSNAVTGFADILSGRFDVSGVHDFALAGFNDFGGLAAGDALSGLSVSFTGLLLGDFDESIVVHARGSNASGYDVALDDVQLRLVGHVAIANPVPEPETYLLMLGGLLSVGLAARRRKSRLAAQAAC